MANQKTPGIKNLKEKKELKKRGKMKVIPPERQSR